MANKGILLLEPGYKNKYPPLGLMKIAQYHGPRGKNDRVTFAKELDRDLALQPWDRVYITTLFSFEYGTIAETIDFAIDVVHGQSQKVFVGGIAASLMHSRFVAETRWRGVRFIKGLLNQAPADALQLDSEHGDFYADDTPGQPIDDLVPDYDILDQIDYRYPVRDAYFAYASRGCIRKCHFCGVPKLEEAQRDAPPLTELVKAVDALYGPKRDLILMDNNVVASPRFKEIIAEIRDLGFKPKATLKRDGERVASQRRVDFNQGVDARILCKDRMYLRELSSICLSPLRIAFDHLGLKQPYEQAIRYAHECELNDLSNYMLYNFHDSPADLFERMHLNVRLNEELGIRIYSFPMRYQPTDLPNRSHIGPRSESIGTGKECRTPDTRERSRPNRRERVRSARSFRSGPGVASIQALRRPKASPASVRKSVARSRNTRSSSLRGVSSLVVTARAMRARVASSRGIFLRISTASSALRLLGASEVMTSTMVCWAASGMAPGERAKWRRNSSG